MRALITGISGFVGSNLEKALTQNGYEVWGTTRNSCSHTVCSGMKSNVIQINYSEEEITGIINEIQPDEIYHLAGQSSVKYSWDNKEETFETNVIITLRMLEALRKSDMRDKTKLILVGSSEEYGLINNGNNPIKETEPLRPISPYGVSKASTSLLFQQYVEVYGLKVIYARPFNHIGPGQEVGFVTSDFAKQISDIEKNIIPPVISVGNLEAKRDFTDVRDIVRAYVMLAQRGMVGEIYNISSGEPLSIKYILDYLLSLSTHKNIKVEQDHTRMRPSEFPVYIGDSSKIKGKISWEKEYSIEQSLQDILDYWRNLN